MKKLVLLISTIALLGNLYAINDEKEKSILSSENAEVTVSINGQVVDKETGEALTGVYVQIEGTDMFTYTDFDGSFSFSHIKPGAYTALVSFISYEKSSVSIEATSKNEVKIELKSATVK